MISFIGNFLAGSWERIDLTVEDIKWTAGTIAVLTLIGILPAFLGTPIKHSFYLAFPIWIFSAYRLLGFWRYIHIAIVGEVVETFQAIGAGENKTVWDSQLAAKYRNAAVNIWLAQTIIFLIAPLYFNLTSGGRLWLPILIMVIFAIAMISLKTGLAIFRATACITIAIFLLFAVHDMFPQVSMIPYVSEASAKLKAGKMAGENARRLENLAAKREKQRQENFSSIIAEAETWQEVNKGKDLPADLKERFEAAKLGLSVSEYKEKLEAEAKAKAKAEKAEAEARAEAKMKTSATDTPAASAVSIEKWKLCWQKPEGYTGHSSLRNLCGIAEVQKSEDSFLAKVFFENGAVANFKGVSLDGKKYQGIWNDKYYSGEFTLNFSSAENAMGFETDQGSTVRKTLVLIKL
jgi:hypothetical protein